MSRSSRNTRFRHARAAGVIVAAAAAFGLSGLAGSGVAAAHVSATGTDLKQGGYGVITLNVPNESDTNAATTELTITIPGLKSARPESKPGWDATVIKDPQSQAVTQISWKAQPGSPGVPSGQFGQFRFSGGKFPNQAELTLPAVQKYSDGEVADWNQQPGPDGKEPEHPAPSVKLGAANDDGHDSSDDTETKADSKDGTDNTARWLGGSGIVIGALGIGAAVGALARGRRS